MFAWAKLIDNNLASTLIEEEIRYKLNSFAYKLYHSKSAFNQLTSQEQKLWKSFPLTDIYECLTGDPNTPPDYQEYVQVWGSTRIQQQPLAQPTPGPPQ
jgi:hypothetical protein